ncbi:MAG: hydroxyisourate hydrolase, partial [Rikenellaceae bacterium]|nr:hydroxyisourate hydrolase [Rikenellaceae bacterium]
MKTAGFIAFIATVFISASVSAQSGYQLSSHILDISEGRSAAGVTVHLYRYNETSHQWDYVYQTKSDGQGRISDLLPSGNDNEATYKFRFDTSEYFRSKGEKSIY